MRNLMLSACLLKRYLANPRNHFGKTRGNIVLWKVDQLFTRVFYENSINSYIRHRDEYLIFARSYIIDFPSVNFFPSRSLLFETKLQQIAIQFFFETTFPYNFFPDNFRIILFLFLFSRKDTNGFWNASTSNRCCFSPSPPPSSPFPLPPLPLSPFPPPPRLFRLYRDKTVPNVNNEEGGRVAISRTRNVAPGANGNPITLEGGGSQLRRSCNKHIERIANNQASIRSIGHTPPRSGGWSFCNYRLHRFRPCVPPPKRNASSWRISFQAYSLYGASCRGSSRCPVHVMAGCYVAAKHGFSVEWL